MDIESISTYGVHAAISVTNSCPLRCAHCISGSSPETPRAASGLEAAFIDFCETWPHIRHITLTGGEPFHFPQELNRFASACKSRNIEYGVITGGFWAKSLDSCERYLNWVPEVHSITVSTDVHHLAFVTMRHVRNAVTACKQRGIRVRVRFSHEKVKSYDENEIENQLLSFLEPSEIEFAPIQRYGRAAESAVGLAYDRWKYDPQTKFGKCPSSGPHIFESGRVIPCCNTIVSIRSPHILEFGNVIRDGAEAVLQNQRSNYFFLVIKVLGFDWLREQLLMLSERYDDYQPLNACDFCFDACSDEHIKQDVLEVISRPEVALLVESVLLQEYGDTQAKHRLSAIASTLRIAETA